VRCLDANWRPSWSCDKSRAPKDRDVCQQDACADDQRPQEVRDGAVVERSERPQHTGRADQSSTPILHLLVILFFVVTNH
jgi:hypothetical protein